MYSVDALYIIIKKKKYSGLKTKVNYSEERKISEWTLETKDRRNLNTHTHRKTDEHADRELSQLLIYKYTK